MNDDVQGARRPFPAVAVADGKQVLFTAIRTTQRPAEMFESAGHTFQLLHQAFVCSQRPWRRRTSSALPTEQPATRCERQTLDATCDSRGSDVMMKGG